MELGSWLPLLGVVGLLVAVVALVAVALLGRTSRAAAERSASRMAADQAETLRWVSGQLHRRLGKHLVNATQRYGEVERRLARVEEKLGRVAHVGEEVLSE